MKKTILLFAALIMLAVSSVRAEQRIYWIADATTITNPAWKTYFVDDMTRFCYIWLGWDNDHIVASAEAGADASPSGGMYTEYTASDYGYAGVAWVMMANNEMDLTPVNENWYFNAWVKSNIASITFTFKGSDGKEIPLELAETHFPASKRTNTVWHQVRVPMYELIDKGLTYATVIKPADNFSYLNLTLGGTTTNVSKFSFDDVYFTDGAGDGLNAVLAPLDFHYADNIITLATDAEAQIFDVTGKNVLNFTGETSVAHLNKGVYVLRSENKIAKFVR